MKTFLIFLVALVLACRLYAQGECIPFLLSSSDPRNKPVYIEDPCVSDTIKAIEKVRVVFQKPISFDNPVVESVSLLNLILCPKDAKFYNYKDKDSYIYLSQGGETPYQQYLWDLCSAKFCYWYKEQPYAGWLTDYHLGEDSNLYMGGVFYLVPPAH